MSCATVSRKMAGPIIGGHNMRAFIILSLGLLVLSIEVVSLAVLLCWSLYGVLKLLSVMPNY